MTFGWVKVATCSPHEKLLPPQDHDQRRADPRLPKIWRWLEACDNFTWVWMVKWLSLVGLSNKSLMRMVRDFSASTDSTTTPTRIWSNSDEIRSVSFPCFFFCQEANCRIRSVLWGWSSALSWEYGRIPACKGIKWKVLPGKVKVHSLAMPLLEFIDVKNSRMRVCSGLLEGMIFGENSLVMEDQMRLPQFWCCYIICWGCMGTGMKRYKRKVAKSILQFLCSTFLANEFLMEKRVYGISGNFLLVLSY